MASTKNGSPSRCRCAADGDLVLLHRLQQRRLRLRRRAVDLVGQDHVGEDRALAGTGTRRLPDGLVLLDHLGAGDVGGHQVGRELDAAELQRQRVGQRADHQRLGQPRHADQQAVPAGEHGHQQLLDHLLLADDHPAQLLGDQPVGLVEFLDGLDVVVFGAWVSPGSSGDSVVMVSVGTDAPKLCVAW